MPHSNSHQNLYKTKITKLQIISYPETIALSLIQYTRMNKNFAIRFWQLLESLDKAQIESNYENKNIDVTIVLPDNEYSAWTRAEWLLERIRKNTTAETAAALRILSAWAQSWGEANEKQVVIGIVGVAIPGITLGLVKRRRPMSVIIRQDFKKDGIGFAKQLAYVTNELVAKASVAGHDDLGLDPDIADWFYYEKDIFLFSACQNVLDKIKEELENLGIINSEIIDDKGLAIMAVSPAVGPHNYENNWGLQKI